MRMAGLRGSSRRGDEPTPFHLTTRVLFPGGRGLHRAGGGKAIPTMAELGTEILVWGTGTQHDACPTPVPVPTQEKSPQMPKGASG